MEANELMINDLVKCGKRLVRISNILSHSASGIELIALEPIPLTAEILEANRFRESIEEGTYYFPKGYKAHERGYAIENECGVWYITVHNLIPFTYVHELQHALRLCGLDELADNFKIK